MHEENPVFQVKLEYAALYLSSSDEAYPRNTLVETFLTAYNIYFNPQETDGNVPSVETRNPDGVFFRGNYQFGAADLREVYKVYYFLLAETVMVSETFTADNFAAELLYKFFKTVRTGYRAERGNLPAFQVIKRESFFLHINVFQVERFVTAFYYFRAAVMLPQE